MDKTIAKGTKSTSAYFYEDNSGYYIPLDVPGIDFPIVVTEVGQSYWNTVGHSVSRRRSPIMAIEYVTRGEVFLRQGRDECVIGAGEVMVLKRGTDHSYETHSVPLRKMYFGLEGVVAGILLDTLGGRIQPIAPQSLCRKFKQLLEIGESKPRDFPQRLSEVAYAIILELISSRRSAMGTSSSIDNVILHAIRFMHDNSHREISVQDLAEHCCVSPPHLYSLFRHRLNISPIRYFHQQKVKTAQNLLLSTNVSCKEIALSLGFDDQLHFSRLFKCFAGVSPTGYRRREDHAGRED